MKKKVLLALIPVFLLAFPALAQEAYTHEVYGLRPEELLPIMDADMQIVPDSELHNGDRVVVVSESEFEFGGQSFTFFHITNPTEGYVWKEYVRPLQQFEGEWSLERAVEANQVRGAYSAGPCRGEGMAEEDCWYLTGVFTLSNPLNCWVTGQRVNPDPTQIWEPFRDLDRAPVIGIPPLAQNLAAYAVNLRPYCVEQDALEGEGSREAVPEEVMVDFFDLTGGNGEPLKLCGPQCFEVPILSQTDMDQSGPWYVTNVCGNWTDGYTTAEGAHPDNIRPDFAEASDAEFISVPPHSYKVPVWGATLRSCEVSYVCSVTPISGQTVSLLTAPDGTQSRTVAEGEILALDGYVNYDGSRYWRITDAVWVLEDESVADRKSVV